MKMTPRILAVMHKPLKLSGDEKNLRLTRKN